jgi:hypothetical protein
MWDTLSNELKEFWPGVRRKIHGNQARRARARLVITLEARGQLSDTFPAESANEPGVPLAIRLL